MISIDAFLSAAAALLALGARSIAASPAPIPAQLQGDARLVFPARDDDLGRNGDRSRHDDLCRGDDLFAAPRAANAARDAGAAHFAKTLFDWEERRRAGATRADWR